MRISLSSSNFPESCGILIDGETEDYCINLEPSAGCNNSYCAADGGTGSYIWIDSIGFNTIQNLSGSNSGYGNFNSLNTTLKEGETYTLSMLFGGTSFFDRYWRVWIDYNGNGSFDDEGELIYEVEVEGDLVTTDITIPTGISYGTAGLRIRLGGSANPESCGTFFFGEVEDYCVNLAPSNICESTSIVNGLYSVPSPTGNGVSLSWNALINADYYHVKGRRIGTLPFGQFITPNTTKNIGGLNSCTSYEWYVRARCGSGGPITSFSPLDTFQTAGCGKYLQQKNIALSCFPNPASDHLNIEIKSADRKYITISIIDVFGRTMFVKKLVVQEGRNHLSIDIQDFRSGSYFVKVVSTENSVSQSIAILR
jgi:hypothetical protein